MNPSPGTSLQNLNDIVVPPEVSWWPVAPAWYVLAGLVLGLLLLLVYRRLQIRARNRYRKRALRELASISQRGDWAAWRKLPVLLKRAALSAWPRAEVAALSGADWHGFLDRTAGTDLFTSGVGMILDRLAYGGQHDELPPEQDLQRAMKAAEFWLSRHDRRLQAGPC